MKYPEQKAIKIKTKPTKFDNKQAIELLRTAEVLEEIDNDVAEAVLNCNITSEKKFSLNDLMLEMQKVKDKLGKQVYNDALKDIQREMDIEPYPKDVFVSLKSREVRKLWNNWKKLLKLKLRVLWK